MKTIAIMEGSTERTIKSFMEIFKKLCLSNDKVRYAKVYYNLNELISYEQDPLTFPLTIYTDDYVFCLADCTAGYGGTGPQGTVEVLKYLDMTFDENEIYRRRENGITNLLIRR